MKNVLFLLETEHQKLRTMYETASKRPLSTSQEFIEAIKERVNEFARAIKVIKNIDKYEQS